MRCSVRVPASSANLGPGFDSMALALELFLTIDATATGAGEARVADGPDLCGGDDLVLEGMRLAAAAAGQPLPGCRLAVRSDIPVARGLGSSAAALVGGLLVANHLLGNPLGRDDLFRLAARAEGHGDNVSAALYGGVTLVVPGPEPRFWPIPLRGELRAVVFIPQRTGLTREARAVVPERVPRADAVSNAARCALLVLGLSGGRCELLGEAMDDRLHQPYRAALFPYLTEMIRAARESGAHGACLSGAGPSVLALAPPDRAVAVARGMSAAATQAGVAGVALDLAIAAGGAEVTPG